jgi:hypothetical protein
LESILQPLKKLYMAPHAKSGSSVLQIIFIAPKFRATIGDALTVRATEHRLVKALGCGLGPSL